MSTSNKTSIVRRSEPRLGIGIYFHSIKFIEAQNKLKQWDINMKSTVKMNLKFQIEFKFQIYHTFIYFFSLRLYFSADATSIVCGHIQHVYDTRHKKERERKIPGARDNAVRREISNT